MKSNVPSFCLTILATLLAGGLGSAVAQEAMATALISREDSARLVRAARQDQAEFERIRRNHLPETWGGGSTRCDERIGRFCLTHGTGRDDWVAPPEEDEVVAARLSLVDGLGRVAELIPGDGWISGQLVRYLVEAKRLDEALEAARDCGGERSWCSALAGFVLHHSARPQPADSAFDAALAAMPEDEREEWLDLTLILDHRSARWYRRLDEAERGPFEERFWRLADPLLTRPGNELRSEHLSRHVWDQLQFRSQSPEGISWGYDLREILLRYGWPSGYERIREFGLGSGSGRPSLVTHYGGAPQDLLPPAEALLGNAWTASAWDEEDPRARTNYSVMLNDSIARWFTPLAHQVAVFRRGDRAVVVANYELPRDSVPAEAEVRAGLALLPMADILDAPTVRLLEPAGTPHALTVEIATGQSLMSLEVIVPSERRIARARYSLDIPALIPGLLSVSDLLLIDPADPLPRALADAIPRARESARVRGGETIGLYWEISGLDPDRTPELTMSLRLLEGRTGWLRRLAERAGLMREVNPIRLQWLEPVTPGEVFARSLTVRIPEVSPGTYTLELSIDAPGREPLSIRKDVDVVAEPPGPVR